MIGIEVEFNAKNKTRTGVIRDSWLSSGGDKIYLIQERQTNNVFTLFSRGILKINPDYT